MPPLLDPVRGVSEDPRGAGEMALALQEDRGAMRFVLDTCEKHGWRCTFFVTARNLRRHQWLDEALTAGHEIGSHSLSHRLLPSLDDNALRMEFSAAASAVSG